MFAIIETGGKQYRAEPGRTLAVEQIKSPSNDEVILDRVLAFSADRLLWGSPHVEGACVVTRIVNQCRDRKIHIFKRRRRKHSKRSAGHRQNLTLLHVESLVYKGEVVAAINKAPSPDSDKPSPPADLSPLSAED